MYTVFGREDGPPVPQALKACEAPGCVAPEALPTTTTPSGGTSPLQPKTAKSTQQPSGSPSPSSSSPTGKPDGSAPPTTPGRPAPPSPTQPPPPSQAPKAAPPGPVTVSYSGSDSGFWEYRGSFTVTNRTGDTLSSWRLGFELSGRSRLRTLWPLPWHREGDAIVVNGGPLSNGASYTVTFVARGRGEPPTGCTLNHRPCVWG
ncbi:cellulose binding domain-containing protein [Actinomadura fulvescens]